MNLTRLPATMDAAASRGSSPPMTFDYATLDSLRSRHPAWRLLRSDHAPLVASFLHRVFLAPNVRALGALDLAEALEDDLFALRQTLGEDAFPRPALDYLNDWAGADKGWLRKYYRPGSDEAQFDLTASAEKALGWLGQLAERSFVGTESRLLTLFELLRQIREGSEADPALRAAELYKRRDALDLEIARVEAGEVAVLDDTALRDRFQQFLQTARELLADFREVEQNFRKLDRTVRERIALWDGSKGALLEEIMGERDAIGRSDQGKSFQAFWEFLLSSSRQEELTELLDRALALPAVARLDPDPRTRRVHYDWLEAGEHTQRTVAQLSQQLRRFLDDQAWLENRRIMEILRGIEAKALALREAPPPGEVMAIAEASASIELPMERPLFKPAAKARLADLAPTEGDDEVDPSALFGQVVVDKARLEANIRRALQAESQVSLGRLVQAWPLRQGLAELLGYLQLGSDAFQAVVDESTEELILWEAPGLDGEVRRKQARMPRVLFVR